MTETPSGESLAIRSATQTKLSRTKHLAGVFAMQVINIHEAKTHLVSRYSDTIIAL